jgi:hypothetical protein
MPRNSKNNNQNSSASTQTKYDAMQTVLDKTYGVLADLRRELADSKTAVAERKDLLNLFADCVDSQRAWLLLEDYFSKLSLARKDFPGNEWWPRMLTLRGQPRLEELALLFMRTHRPLPTELAPCTNYARLAQIEQAEKEKKFIEELELWLFPPLPHHLDAPRASLRVLCTIATLPDQPHLHTLNIEFNLCRPRAGEKIKSAAEIIELTLRSTHEQELFSSLDWGFISWLADNYRNCPPENGSLSICGLDLLKWLSCWGNNGRLELMPQAIPLYFCGQMAELVPALEDQQNELGFTQRISIAENRQIAMNEAICFGGQPALILYQGVIYLLRNAPAPSIFNPWLEKKRIPVSKMSHRFLAQLRKSKSGNGADWDKICIAHKAKPQFTFELTDEVVRLRLLAVKIRRAHV